MIDALVVAGSPNNGRLKSCSNVEFEALIPIGKRVMIEYVVEALLKAQKVNKIVIVGPQQLKNIFAHSPVEVVVQHNGIASNVKVGLAHLPQSKYVLLVPADVPLVMPETIDCFINSVDFADDFYFPVIPKDTVEKKFPHIKRTYATLQDGTFTGGNIFVVNTQAVSRGLERGEEFIALRKSPLKLCRLLGTSFLIKFLMKRLTIAETEKKVSSILGINCRAVFCSTPEMGVDVDKPSDLSLVEQTLNIRGF